MLSRLKSTGYSSIALATLLAGAQAGMGAELYWAGTTSDWSATKVSGMSAVYTNWRVYYEGSTTRTHNPAELPNNPDTIIFQLPGTSASHTVTFGLTGNVGGTTILFNDAADAPFTIQSQSNAALYIFAAAGALGLSVSSGSAAHTITSNLVIKDSQTWEIATPTIPNANTFTVSGVISSESTTVSPLIKTGGGTLLLSGRNTYTYGTAIHEGTLRLEKPDGKGASSQTGSGNVLIEAAGTLAGTGTASGPVNLYGTLQPGGIDIDNNPTLGILTTGSQHWFDGAHLSIRLKDLPGDSGMGTGWDGLQVKGDVDFGPSGQFVIEVQSLGLDFTAGELAGLGSTSQASWKILSLTDGEIVNFDSSRFTVNTRGFAGDLDGAGFSLRSDEDAVYLEFAPIPEPGSLSLLALTSSLLLKYRRKMTPAVHPG